MLKTAKISVKKFVLSVFLYYCVCSVMYFIVHAAFMRIKLMMMMMMISLLRWELFRGQKIQRFIIGLVGQLVNFWQSSMS